ncbi:MAG: nucleotidyltransferase family protein, partial [Leptolyngbya sp.]|nr:nucleotidyltransferase family protein [Leptolyngbya sp.]
MITASLDEILLSLLRLNPDPVAQQTALAHLSAAEGDALVAKAVDQRVVGLVYQALQSLPEGAVPETILSPLRASSQQVARFTLALVRELKAILSTLNAADIPVIVLKGSHLAQSVYPQLHLRQMGDIDLLVPQDRVVQAYERIQNLGYEVYHPYLDDVVEAPAVLVSQNHGHHLTPLRKAPELPLVELHWTLCDADEAADFNLEEIWQRSVPTTFLGESARVLAPEDLILHLCHHAAYHHQFDMGVQGIVDISRIVDRFQAQMDWNALQRTAEAWGWQRGVYLTLALTEAMMGLPLPAQMAQSIQAIMPSPDFIAQTQALLLESKTARQTLAQVLSQEAADQALRLNLIQR